MIAKLKAAPLQTEQYIKENAFSPELLLAKNNEWQERKKMESSFLIQEKYQPINHVSFPFKM